MSKYINLNIKIDLEGDIKETISEYDYSVNTDSNSKYKKIYIPYRTLIGNKDSLKTGLYSKDPKQNFLTIERMNDFLYNRSEILKNLSKQLKKNITIASDKSDKKPLEDKRDEVIKYINKSNIDIILSLFFKIKSYFYYKNNKYIINNFTVIDYELNKISNIQELPSYNDFVIKLIKEKQEELYQYALLKLENTKKKDFFYNKAIDEVTRNKDLENIIKKRAEITVNKYNKQAKRKKENIEYIYVNKIGIQVKNTSSLIKNIEIKLNITNFKRKHISNIKYSCKTRKKKIHSIIKELFGILDDNTSKDNIKNNVVAGYNKYYNQNYNNFLKKKKTIQDTIIAIYDSWNKLSPEKQATYIKSALADQSIKRNITKKKKIYDTDNDDDDDDDDNR